MKRTVLLLRGINVGAHNRVPMAKLREQLAAAGLEGVRTHLQSGNVIVDGDAATASTQLRTTLREDFAVDVPVVARTRAELADVVAANPLASVATDPKLYQVTFLSEALEPAQ